MAENRLKTGENVPETGKYKVDGFVNEDDASQQDDTEINVEEGEQFPPSPTSHKAVYWKKTS
ncbi:YjzC family protein [Sediminibacillus dalangtanensis]|uniref:YjzC family protein n=1 Tax=Sediminibacillus dalangtanensis TaxID=2729421 RepID=A0ABX7VME8_9BACI|nr:YjzC family protein [Sediminibacillus dalangtanensis]QTM97982.1 YjzC family protein [Sediminibacillus dalangtanensis]